MPSSELLATGKLSIALTNYIDLANPVYPPISVWAHYSKNWLKYKIYEFLWIF